MAKAIVSTVRPKASETPSRPMPTSGKAAASTALPQPPNRAKRCPGIPLRTCSFDPPWLQSRGTNRSFPQRGPDPWAPDSTCGRRDHRAPGQAFLEGAAFSATGAPAAFQAPKPPLRVARQGRFWHRVARALLPAGRLDHRRARLCDRETTAGRVVHDQLAEKSLYRGRQVRPG